MGLLDGYAAKRILLAGMAQTGSRSVCLSDMGRRSCRSNGNRNRLRGALGIFFSSAGPL